MLFTRRREGGRGWRLPAVLACLVVAVAACSSGGSGGGGAPPGQVGKEQATLKVVACCAVPTLVNLYAANQLGYFTDEDLDVQITESSTNATNLVVSGQDDIGVFAPGGILTAATEGKAVSIVYGYVRAGTASLVGRKGVTDVHECKRIAGLAVGSSTYGGAALYNAKLNLGAQVVPMNDFPTILASLASGSIDCAAGTYTTYAPRIASGDLTALIDTRDPAVRTKYWGDPSVAEGTYFGVTKNLEAKRDAVTRFLAAVDRAGQWAATTPPDQVAATLGTYKGFANTPPQQLAKDFGDIKSLLFAGEPTAGQVPQSSWSSALSLYRSWGLDKIDPANPDLAYDHVVDMSYLTSATACRQQKNCP